MVLACSIYWRACARKNGTYLRTSTRLYGQLLMPDSRVEFAKTPVGSNSFDRGYPANSQWSNVPKAFPAVMGQAQFDPTIGQRP
jgi:hypothetical protein